MTQAWTAIYHSDVFNDLQSMAKIDAAKVLKIIESSLILEPSCVGISVEPALPNCRLLKSDDFHILYQLVANRAQVYVLAIRQETGLFGCGGQKAETHREVG